MPINDFQVKKVTAKIFLILQLTYTFGSRMAEDQVFNLGRRQHRSFKRRRLVHREGRRHQVYRQHCRKVSSHLVKRNGILCSRTCGYYKVTTIWHQSNYSGGSNTELGIPNAIPIPNVSKFGFRMVQTIRKPNFLPFENRTKWLAKVVLRKKKKLFL